MSSGKGIYPYCEKSTQYSIHSRRCFMTGELCSKQSSVHRKREELHDENEINAFVVMNFSDMSDVVYKWKLRSFIESLKKFLFLKKEEDRDHPGKSRTTAIACVAKNKDDIPEKERDKWVPVKNIRVVRADSNTESNYVICDRVCQQMQIADLIIVDVSVENTNVFYEFGMAAAFGKLILPICYNESFYQMRLPEGAKRFLEERRAEAATAEFSDGKKQKIQNLDSIRKMLEHHIDSYPWRRKLFEYYGIRFRKGNSEVGYTNFRDITNPVFGFSDLQYTRFPYDHQIDEWAIPGEAQKNDKNTTKKNPFGYDVVDDGDRKKVGYHLYNRLRTSYNQKMSDENDPSPFNTLVVYTMDGVMNGEQAGQCIINYYRHMTARIQEEHCFCGDRVGILGQSNKIHDDPKDTKTDQKLMYKVSDIIRIGMNEATHMAMQKKIKTEDYLSANHGPVGNEDWSEDILRYVKEYVRNRCIPAYPDEPIYVDQLEHGVQKQILTKNIDDEERKYYFCLFHVMLHTLRYTNEIVVDLSRNSLQALFWLGVAHGSDAHAITVRHMPTEQELKQLGEQTLPSERHIFDVAGLWTAILRSNDTDGFYQQLAKAQVGIEQSSKLLQPDSEKYQESVLEQYHAPSPYMKGGYSNFREKVDALSGKDGDSLDGEDIKQMLKLLRGIGENERLCKIWDALTERNKLESKQLESYYRSRFWSRLLRQNALHIYIPEKKGKTEGNNQPCRVNISWDVSATAELSHYLSKRLMIGSYRQTMLREAGPQPEVWNQNFISIGNDTKPFSKGDSRLTLVDYAREKLPALRLRKMDTREVTCGYRGESKRLIRGFFEPDTGDGKTNVFAWFPIKECIEHINEQRENDEKKKRQDAEKDQRKDAEKDQRRETGNAQLNEEEKKGIYHGNEPLENVKCSLENRNLGADDCYTQLAQLLLWREPTGESRKEMRFWVSLVGVSGPATLALTTLLVNPEQREELFRRDGILPKADAVQKKSQKHLLNMLQSDIRAEFLEKYNALLENNLAPAVLPQVRYATNLYLSTILYQYFFPFLTIADEMRIKNGMDAFLAANRMGVEASVDWNSVEDGVKEALKEALEALYGVESLYTVTVAYNDSDTDSRWPKGIEPLKKGLCCLFREKADPKKENK